MSIRVSAGRRLGPEAEFVPGAVEPTRENTGLVAAGVAEYQLANYAGSLTNISPGDVVRRLAITGQVVAQGAIGSKLKHCRVAGPSSGSLSGGLVNCDGSNVSNFQIEMCDIFPGTTTQSYLGITGHDFKDHRSYVAGGTDAIRIRNVNSGKGSAPSGVEVVGGFYGKLFAIYGAAAGHSDYISHTDPIQIEGGTGSLIDGATLYGYLDPNLGQANIDGTWDNANARATGDGNPYWPDMQSLSCLIVTPNVGSCDGGILRNSTLRGGTAKINMADGSYSCRGWLLDNNKYAPDGLNTGLYRSNGGNWTRVPYLFSSTALRDTITRTNNVWLDTGAAAN